MTSRRSITVGIVLIILSIALFGSFSFLQETIFTGEEDFLSYAEFNEAPTKTFRSFPGQAASIDSTRFEVSNDFFGLPEGGGAFRSHLYIKDGALFVQCPFISEPGAPQAFMDVDNGQFQCNHGEGTIAKQDFTSLDLLIKNTGEIEGFSNGAQITGIKAISGNCDSIAGSSGIKKVIYSRLDLKKGVIIDKGEPVCEFDVIEPVKIKLGNRVATDFIRYRPPFGICKLEQGDQFAIARFENVDKFNIANLNEKPEKLTFCLNDPAILIRSDGGIDRTAEVYPFLISGKDFIIPQGIKTVIPFFIVRNSDIICGAGQFLDTIAKKCVDDPRKITSNTQSFKFEVMGRNLALVGRQLQTEKKSETDVIIKLKSASTSIETIETFVQEGKPFLTNTEIISGDFKLNIGVPSTDRLVKINLNNQEFILTEGETKKLDNVLSIKYTLKDIELNTRNEVINFDAQFELTFDTSFLTLIATTEKSSLNIGETGKAQIKLNNNYLSMNGKIRYEFSSAAFFIGEQISFEKIKYTKGETITSTSLISNELGAKILRINPIIDFEGIASIQFPSTLVNYGIKGEVTPTGAIGKLINLVTGEESKTVAVVSPGGLTNRIEVENKKVIENVVKPIEPEVTFFGKFKKIIKTIILIISGIALLTGLLLFAMGLLLKRRRK